VPDLAEARTLGQIVEETQRIRRGLEQQRKLLALEKDLDRKKEQWVAANLIYKQKNKESDESLGGGFILGVLGGLMIGMALNNYAWGVAIGIVGGLILWGVLRHSSLSPWEKRKEELGKEVRALQQDISELEQEVVS